MHSIDTFQGESSTWCTGHTNPAPRPLCGKLTAAESIRWTIQECRGLTNKAIPLRIVHLFTTTVVASNGNGRTVDHAHCTAVVRDSDDLADDSWTTRSTRR
jgi:hypothetical protein